MKSVYCAVRTGYLNKAVWASSVNGKKNLNEEHFFTFRSQRTSTHAHTQTDHTEMTVAHLLKIFPPCYDTRRFITAFTTAFHLILYWVTSAQLTHLYCSYLTSKLTHISIYGLAIQGHCLEISFPRKIFVAFVTKTSSTKTGDRVFLRYPVTLP